MANYFLVKIGEWRTKCNTRKEVNTLRNRFKKINPKLSIEATPRTIAQDYAEQFGVNIYDY